MPVASLLGAAGRRRVQLHDAARPERTATRAGRLVGIAGPDEIEPIARPERRKRPIQILDQPRKRVEVVEHVEDFARVESAGFAACRARRTSPAASAARDRSGSGKSPTGRWAFCASIQAQVEWMIVRSPPSARAEVLSVSGDPPGYHRSASSARAPKISRTRSA